MAPQSAANHVGNHTAAFHQIGVLEHHTEPHAGIGQLRGRRGW